MSEPTSSEELRRREAFVESDAPRIVARVLEQLGATSQDVAQSIRQRGLSGVPGHFTACPVARAVRQSIATYRGLVGEETAWLLVSVGEDATFIGYEWIGEDGHTYTAPLDKRRRIENPLAVQAFIRRFDTGSAFQDLREPGTTV